MSDRPCFIDSNIWLYRLMTDPTSDQEDEIRKRSLAINLINAANSNSTGIVSTQVINEVCSVLMRKASFDEVQIQRIIGAFYYRCRVIEQNVDVLLGASSLRLQYRFSFWDGLIVASALLGGAEVLYSEDMQDGLVVEHQLEIVNPFK